MLAAVESVIQRQPIVALFDGFACVFQRIVGGDELVVRVLVRARSASRIDRALRLLHLLFGWVVSAGKREERRSQHDHAAARANARHVSSIARWSETAFSYQPSAFGSSLIKMLSGDRSR